VLIHDYQVDAAGIVTAANLLVATQQNLAAIEATIGQAAQRYLDRPDETILDEIEFGIRCYDPCLSCATHRLGEMKLEVVIRQDGQPLRALRRR
jgi:F420-non-reducing hydrogenase large subunit